MATRRNYDDTPYRRSSAPAWAMVMITALCAVAFLAFLYPDLAHMPGVPSLPALPTEKAIVAPYTAPKPNVQGAIDRYNQAQEATAAAVQGAPAAPLPNVNITGDSAPVVVESRTFERQPAGDNVPTAEPVQETQSDAQFGSKAIITAPQETHECRHGQVWTDSGCKNPTPVK